MDLSEYTNIYISKANNFYPYRNKVIVYAYVESNEDKAFWSKILSKFSNYRFEIEEIKAQSAVKENIPNAPGKDALMKIKNLGKNKIICIDADFDILIDNYHYYTEELRTNDYIVNTEYYSIENILSQPSNLRCIIKDVTSYDSDKCYDEFLNRFSETIEDLLLLNIAAKTKSKRERLPSVYGQSHFNSDLNNLRFSMSEFVTNFNSFGIQYHQDRASLLSELSQDLLSIQTKMRAKGYQSKDAYKFMNGHILYNLVIRELLKQENSRIMVANGKYYHDNPSATKTAFYACQNLDESIIPDSVKIKLNNLYGKN